MHVLAPITSDAFNALIEEYPVGSLKRRLFLSSEKFKRN